MDLPIEVCWTSLTEDANISSLTRLLTPEECERAVHFRFARDRSRFIAGRGLLREFLAHRLGCAPTDVRLTCNEFGKPCLASGDLRFNISHAGDVTLFVFARMREVGCDIEWRDDQLPVDDLAERFFAAGERDALRRLPPELRAEGFFNGWTRREAFTKALGVGLSLPLDSVEVSLAPGEPAMFLRGGTGWSIHAFEPIPGMHAAIVVEGSGVVPMISGRAD